MKTIFLILALLLSGCNVDVTYTAKVGDCFMDEVTSSGETMIFKVLKIGSYSLQTLGSDGYIYTHRSTEITRKVDCFDRFPNK